jgi:hypothetical protein
MIERLVGAMAATPEYSAVSCFRLDFSELSELANQRYVSANRPVGGPLVMACFHNIFGETSGLFRTADLRAAGGYDDLHSEYVSEDWHLYVKLAALGYKIGVVPEHLYYYRVRPTSRFRSGNLYINHLQILDQFAKTDTIPVGERYSLWNLVVALQQTAEGMKRSSESLGSRLELAQNEADALRCQLSLAQTEVSEAQRRLHEAHVRLGRLRYRAVDTLARVVGRLPALRTVYKTISRRKMR